MKHGTREQGMASGRAAGDRRSHAGARVVVALWALLALWGVVAGDVIGAEHRGHRRLVAEASWLPVDVELVIASEGGGGLVRPPLGPVLLDFVGQGVPMTATMSAWDEFARLLRMEPLEAFDAVLAERFVFAARRVPETPRRGARPERAGHERGGVADAPIDSERVEWVIVTLLDDATARRLTQALRAAPRGVRDGRPQLVLEGGTFTLDLKPAAQRGQSWMAIGPTAASGLVDLARLDGPGARVAAPDAVGRVPGRIGSDRGFDSIRAMARSFHSPLDETEAALEMAIAAEAAGEVARSRFFVYARLDERERLIFGRRSDRPAEEIRSGRPATDWVAVFGEASGRMIRLDSLKRSSAMLAAESEVLDWPAAPFESLADGALSAGMIAGPALRARLAATEPGDGILGGLGHGDLAGIGLFGGVAEQLGLPVTRLAWTLNDRGGAFDAAIALETAAVDGLVAQGDAFMRAMLAPLMGGELQIRQGIAVGHGVNDHSMRLVRTPRPLAWIPKGEAVAPGAGLGGSVAWTFRVCPVAARADEGCPSAWWTVGLSPELVAATTDRLTEEHLGLPQRWLALLTMRPRALIAQLETTGLPLPGGLDQLRRVELVRWREAMLPNGFVLGQGVIEAAAEEVVERQR